MHFQTPQRVTPVKTMRPKGQIGTTGIGSGGKRFNGISRNRTDFQYDEAEAKSARPDRCPEHPSLLNLSMDALADFQTVKMMSYNNTNSNNNTTNNFVKKNDRKYTPPKDKFDGTTTNHDAFQNYGAQPRVSGIVRSTSHPISSAVKKNTKNSSSYATSFKNPGGQVLHDRILYNAQHKDNINLPPKSEKFAGKSVMHASYRQNIGSSGMSNERAKPFKPDHSKSNHQGSKEPFQGTTQYNEIFKGDNSFNHCVFPKFLAQEVAAKRFATVV